MRAARRDHGEAIGPTTPIRSPHDCHMSRGSVYDRVFQGGFMAERDRARPAASANFDCEVGKVFAWEAGKSVSYDDDIATDWEVPDAVRENGKLKLYVSGALVPRRPIRRFSLRSHEQPAAADRLRGGKLLLRGNARRASLPPWAQRSGSKGVVRPKDKPAAWAPGFEIIASPGRFEGIGGGRRREDKVNFWGTMISPTTTPAPSVLPPPSCEAFFRALRVWKVRTFD